MKKLLLPLILAVLFLSGCKDGFLEELFTLKSVKTVGKDEISRLKQEAGKYEKKVSEKMEHADQLGAIYQELGVKYNDRRSWDPAIDSLKKAIGYGRDSARVHYQLALAYANRGVELDSDKDLDKAEYHYRKTLSLQPEYTEARYSYSIFLYYSRGQKEKATQILKELVVSNPSYYQARFALARFHYENKQPQKALSIYERLYADLQKLPDSSQVREYRENCRNNIQRIMREISGGP
ncbi:MAG TPA: tetratricopeptide repeat protein [Spirochaetota bacterium]|nr:tetratricopeptide repeat protein [Spirochaetota bacterium]